MLGSAKFARIPLAVLVLALLARAVGPEGVGKWAMTVAIAVFFHSFFLTWTQAQAVRFGREEWQSTGTLAGLWAARRPLVLLGLGAAVGLLVLQPYAFFEKVSGLPASWWPLALAYLLGFWCLNEAQILLQTTGRFTRLAWLPVAIDTVVAGYLALVLLLRPANMLAWCLVGIVAISATMSLVAWVSAFAAARCLGGRTAWEQTRRLVRLGWPVSLAFLFGYVSDWGDHYVLRYFAGAQEVGLFQSGYQAMVAMMSLAAPLSVVLLPRIVDESVRDPSAQALYLRRTVPLVSAVALLAIIPCIGLVPWVFDIVFGPAFAPAHFAFLMLCIGVPGAIFTYLYSILFTLQGRNGANTLYIAAMAATNLSLSITLVPRMGLVGAAVGTSVSYVLVQLLYMFDQHRRTEASMAAPAALFLIALLFGLAQAFVGEEALSRAITTLVGIAAVILAARKLRVADGHAITDAFPKPLSWLGRCVNRALMPR
jgi:O-antigen/teichoic acid export membrane protein